MLLGIFETLSSKNGIFCAQSTHFITWLDFIKGFTKVAFFKTANLIRNHLPLLLEVRVRSLSCDSKFRGQQSMKMSKYSGSFPKHGNFNCANNFKNIFHMRQRLIKVHLGKISMLLFTFFSFRAELFIRFSTFQPGIQTIGLPLIFFLNNKYIVNKHQLVVPKSPKKSNKLLSRYT